MATPPDTIRTQLAVIMAAAATDLTAAAVTPDDALSLLSLVVPAYYDMAGALAVAWYDELRDEAQPASTYLPTIIGDPTTDWIEREVAKFQKSLEADLEDEAQRLIDETARLVEKEVARGYRDSILGNARMDDDAVGWSRVTRSGACKMCAMLADKGAVFKEATAHFAAHTDCHCAARPEFRNGEHGPEASVMQYVASSKRPKDPKKLAERNAKLRAYLNEHYPDARG